MKTANHRVVTEERTTKFSFGETLTRQIRSLCKTHQITASVLIEYLIEFYEMKHLGLLTERVKAMYDRGLTAHEINQLSVLYTLLQSIDDRIGLY